MRLSNRQLVFVQTGSVRLQNGYTWAKELARKIGIPFRVFLNIPHEDSQVRLRLLNQLLEADGYYFTHYNQVDVPKTNLTVMHGDFYSNLTQYLHGNPHDVIVLAEGQSSLTQTQLNQLLDFPNGFVLLQDTKVNEADMEHSFYDIFKNSKVYNLPCNLKYGIRIDLGILNFIYPLLFRMYR